MSKALEEGLKAVEGMGKTNVLHPMFQEIVSGFLFRRPSGAPSVYAPKPSAEVVLFVPKQPRD